MKCGFLKVGSERSQRNVFFVKPNKLQLFFVERYSIISVEATILLISNYFMFRSNLHSVFCSLVKVLTRLSSAVVLKLNISSLTFPKLVPCYDGDGWDSVDERKMTGNKKILSLWHFNLNILELHCWPQNSWLK